MVGITREHASRLLSELARKARVRRLNGRLTIPYGSPRRRHATRMCRQPARAKSITRKASIGDSPSARRAGTRTLR